MKTFVISLTGDINLYFSHKHIHEQIIFFHSSGSCCCCCCCMCALSYLSLAIVLSFIAGFRLMLCFFDLPCVRCVSVLFARARERACLLYRTFYKATNDKMRAAPNKPAENLNKRQNHKNQCIWFKRAPKENFFLASLPRMRLYCFTSAGNSFLSERKMKKNKHQLVIQTTKLFASTLILCAAPSPFVHASVSRLSSVPQLSHIHNTIYLSTHNFPITLWYELISCVFFSKSIIRWNWIAKWNELHSVFFIE